jgi:hypothetical protein
MSRARKWGGLCLAAALALLAAWAYHRETREAWVWPSDTAALVEGQPITMDELKQVLDWGLYGQLSREEGASAPAPESIPLLVLEKMIEERLVLAEAARFNFSIDAAEKEISAAHLDEMRTKPGLSSDQAETLRLNLLRQLVLHKITSKIMAAERRFSAADWRVFWRDWPKKVKPTHYLVRVLFLPPAPEAPKVPKAKNLDQMAQLFKLEGFPVLLSPTVLLHSDRLDSDLKRVLENAWAGQNLSPPVRQDGSWAVYEILNLDRKTAAVAELTAARTAYEFKTGEEAFRRWLAARRSAADIRINPNLTQIRE